MELNDPCGFGSSEVLVAGSGDGATPPRISDECGHDPHDRCDGPPSFSFCEFQRARIISG